MENKKELLKPKVDVVFHSLFKQGNEDITKAIITSVTGEKIDKIVLNNDRHIIGKYTEEKLGILDLKAILDDGVICNIEIQLADNKDTAERFLYYWSRLYSGQLIKGEDYIDAKKVIGIVILDYEYDKLKEIEEMHTKWEIKETLTGADINLTNVFEMHIIEISKAKKMLKKDPKNELGQWIAFLDDPNQTEVSEYMKENKKLEKAMNELEEISANEEIRRIAELREKGIRDERNGLRHAKEEGIQQGIQAGIEEGKRHEKIQTAKKMLEKGIETETIIEITGLTEEEIKELQK